ncbi:MAG: hypothetical protein HQ463_05060 [Bacteroidetes bacterium]|nr:hypothetical protein [Bacteroidota bacterium]
MEQFFIIDRVKAEAPVMATFGVFSIFFSLLLYPYLLWWAFLVFPFMAFIYLILSKSKLGFFNRQCFLHLNNEGIRYSFHLYQKPVFIAWHLIERVNYQLYEINLKISESGLLVSIPIGYLKTESDFEKIRIIIDEKTSKIIL